MVYIQRLVFTLLIGAALGLAKTHVFKGGMNGGGTSTGLRLAETAGVSGLSRADLSLLTGLAMIYCMVLGIVSNIVLGSKGLGYFLHTVIAFFGLLATVFVYSRIWGVPTADDSLALIIAAIATSILAIVVAAFAKMLLVGEVDSFGAGGGILLSKSAPRRGSEGPSLDRLNLASRKYEFY